jgi:hypothetical protein
MEVGAASRTNVLLAGTGLCRNRLNHAAGIPFRLLRVLSKTAR